MTLRNVPKSFTLEQQRLEINELAIDLDAAVDGVQTFTGDKTFADDISLTGGEDAGIRFYDGAILYGRLGQQSTNRLELEGTQELHLSANGDIRIKDRTWDSTRALFKNEGSVELYFQEPFGSVTPGVAGPAVKKFETTDAGASVIGALDVYKATGLGRLEFTYGSNANIIIGDDITANAIDINLNNTIENIFIGIGAGADFVQGNGNNFIGFYAGRQDNPSGSDYAYFNNIIGYYAAQSLTSGSYNQGIGEGVLSDLTSGDRNIAIGNYSGSVLTTGDHNILLGESANVTNVSDSFNVVIGKDITVDGNNNLAIGINGEKLITGVKDGSVDLYYNNLKKFETTSTGVSITGNIDSVADVSASGDVALADDKVLNFGAGSDGRISYTSSTNRFYVRTPGGSADLILGAGPAVRITNEDGLTDRAVFDANGLTVTGTVDADAFTVNGASLQTDVATTSSVGTVQPDGTTIAIDGAGVISVTGGGDPFTADGFKFGVNEGSGPAATQGEFRQIGGKPYFYDGTAWQEFILGSTQATTIPAETAWDKVIVRSTFDSDFDDVKFGDTGNPNTYTAGYNGTGINASTLVATPAKFGTNVLKSVGNGVVYPHRAEYDFTGEFTIECWVYFDSAPETYTQAFLEKHVIFSKANAAFTDGSWQVYVKQAANGNHFWYMDIHDTATNSETQYALESIGQSWSSSGYDQQWVHIALVKESDGTLHFYTNGVDGLYTHSYTVSGNDITNTTHPLAIGMPQEGGQAINDIYIDDLRITTDARYTSSGIFQNADFTPPTTAHPISGTTTTYTPPATSKAGEITLGATPTWTGTAGVTVTQQSSGNYRMTFTNPFTNATDYYVFTNHMDYIGAQKVFVTTGRSNTHVDFTVYREGDGAFVDTGSVAVQVIAH